jgi:hypothetical protein
MMDSDKFSFKDYANGDLLVEKKKKKKKKKARGGLSDSWYTTGMPGGSSGTDGGSAVGESLLSELFAGITPSSFSANINSATAFSQNNCGEEEAEGEVGRTKTIKKAPTQAAMEPAGVAGHVKGNKVDAARNIFKAMVFQPDITRAEILNAFIDEVGVTQSTAVSYYTRFLDEFNINPDDVGNPDAGGAGGMGGDEEQAGVETPYGEPEPIDPDELEEPEDPRRAGFIRTVDNAHLIYKQQSENGTYEELWIYNIHDDSNDELNIRRDILAGTDIPPQKTKSPDGVQSYTATTMGNAQLLKITGLPN